MGPYSRHLPLIPSCFGLRVLPLTFCPFRLVSEAMQRKIFGKRLMDQPVIRFKLAQMAADVESVHSMLEANNPLLNPTGLVTRTRKMTRSIMLLCTPHISSIVIGPRPLPSRM